MTDHVTYRKFEKNGSSDGCARVETRMDREESARLQRLLEQGRGYTTTLELSTPLLLL